MSSKEPSERDFPPASGLPLGSGKTAISVGGVQIVKNDWLPPNTMMVSPDVYEALTETPEQAAQKLVQFKTQVDKFQELLKARGLSPTGCKPSDPQFQELPK